LPVPREPECSITHTAPASSRQTSMKWLPPPRVPIWRSSLSVRSRRCLAWIASSRVASPDLASRVAWLSGRRRCSPPRPLPAGTQCSIAERSLARLSGRSLARSVVRRAERAGWRAAEIYGTEPSDGSTPGGVNPLALGYLNRLSDLLFILGRAANPDGDVLWVPGGERQ